MSGRCGADRSGQLATLDAIVFFSAAILVSSILLSYSVGSLERSDVKPSQDPANLLDVFLRASVGADITLVLGKPSVIRSNEQIGECLVVELRALSEGLPVDAFLPLNQRLSDSLEQICGLLLDHRLIVSDNTSGEILAIGSEIAAGGRNAFASSMDLRDINGTDYLVMLVISGHAH